MLSFDPSLKRVLVCDPNPLLADAICAGVERCGVFTTRASGSDLLASALAFRPDVVVVDPSRFPSAPDVLRVGIAEHLPQCQVLAYVKVGDDDAALRCLAAGFAGVVSQGRSIEVLVEAVYAIGMGGIYVDQAFRLTNAPSRKGSAADEDRPSCPLSPREQHVLEQVARGLSNKEIAGRLGISPKTIETHRARASAKLGLRSRSAVVQHALQHGWLADQLRAA